MKRMGKKKHPNHPNIMTLHDSFWFLPERWKQKKTLKAQTHGFAQTNLTEK
jgi:hypothetical protein